MVDVKLVRARDQPQVAQHAVVFRISVGDETDVARVVLTADRLRVADRVRARSSSHADTRPLERLRRQAVRRTLAPHASCEPKEDIP
jgi:hypothetical protein